MHSCNPTLRSQDDERWINGLGYGIGEKTGRKLLYHVFFSEKTAGSWQKYIEAKNATEKPWLSQEPLYHSIVHAAAGYLSQVIFGALLNTARHTLRCCRRKPNCHRRLQFDQETACFCYAERAGVSFYSAPCSNVKSSSSKDFLSSPFVR